MASPRSSEREEERRHNLLTLAIASAASATAAVVTSQLWFAGTWIAAALTPVLVALVSELLHRPTERIAERLTADRPALRAEREEQGESAEARPSSAPAESEPPPVRVYRSGAQPARRRKIAVGAVLGTGALALLIAVVVLTVPELVTGESIGGKGRTTLFSPDRERSASQDDKQQTKPEETEEPKQTTEETTEETTTDEETTTEETTDEEPPATTPPEAEPPSTQPAPTPPEQP